MTKVITSQELEETIKATEGVVVVDFFADWCAPCKALSPIIDSIDEPDVKVFKVNIDESPEAAQVYEIFNLPTIAFIKNGILVEKLVGAKPKNVIIDTINSIK
jgi:thioredoxin 1